MKRLFLLFIAIIFAVNAFAWGPKGHDTVAYIAEQHLSKRSLKRIQKALGGHSMVYVANWMDNASHGDEYAYTKTWHYVNVDPSEVDYASSAKEAKGDVVSAVSVPVVANGDVFEAEDAIRIKKWTGAAGIMIGRATFGNPWLFSQCREALSGNEVSPLPSLLERLAVAEEQIALSARQKSEKIAVLEARRHIAWYLRGVRGGNAYKIRVNGISTLEELHRLLEEIKHTLG